MDNMNKEFMDNIEKEACYVPFLREEDCKSTVYDMNKLYEAHKRAEKGSAWKSQVQRFDMFWLAELSKLSEELENETFDFSPVNKFIINERGKTRAISSQQYRDRVVIHNVVDNVVWPNIEPYLIYDNGAGVKGKGVSFTRERLKKHLLRYFAETGSNEGYILLMDFSKYYDNMHHDKLKNLFHKYVTDEHALYVLDKSLENARVDVSYMTDEEYAECMNKAFSSLEHNGISKALLTGEKYMDKSLDIGSQISHIAGLLYPLAFDNYIKIVEGNKYYARYTDDSYVIDSSREYLEELLSKLRKIASEYGIILNETKTRICRVAGPFDFLQNRYHLTKTGKVTVAIKPMKLIKFRRKLKKLALQMDDTEFKNYYNSWYNSQRKYMDKQQRDNLNKLYRELEEGIICRLNDTY